MRKNGEKNSYEQKKKDKNGTDYKKAEFLRKNSLEKKIPKKNDEFFFKKSYEKIAKKLTKTELITAKAQFLRKKWQKKNPKKQGKY